MLVDALPKMICSFLHFGQRTLTNLLVVCLSPFMVSLVKKHREGFIKLCSQVQNV